MQYSELKKIFMSEMYLYLLCSFKALIWSKFVINIQSGYSY